MRAPPHSTSTQKCPLTSLHSKIWYEQLVILSRQNLFHFAFHSFKVIKVTKTCSCRCLVYILPCCFTIWTYQYFLSSLLEEIFEVMFMRKSVNVTSLNKLAQEMACWVWAKHWSHIEFPSKGKWKKNMLYPRFFFLNRFSHTDYFVQSFSVQNLVVGGLSLLSGRFRVWLQIEGVMQKENFSIHVIWYNSLVVAHQKCTNHINAYRFHWVNTNILMSPLCWLAHKNYTDKLFRFRLKIKSRQPWGLSWVSIFCIRNHLIRWQRPLKWKRPVWAVNSQPTPSQASCCNRGSETARNNLNGTL